MDFDDFYNIGFDIATGYLQDQAQSLAVSGLTNLAKSAGSALTSPAMSQNLRGSRASTQSLASQESSAKRSRLTQKSVESGVSGGSKTCAAQFNPGRGAELSWTQQNLLNAIRFKTGELPGPDAVSAWGQERKFYKGQKLSIGFAFKAILDAELSANADQVPTRFYVHNVYRHTKAEVCGVATDTTAQGLCQYNRYHLGWNTTLGPDASLIRQAPNNALPTPFTTGGTCHPPATGPGSAVGNGFSPNIVSPFRYPLQGDVMYSRLTRQNLENFMWNANPLKIAYVQPMAMSQPLVNTTTAMQVLDNGYTDYFGQFYSSHPHQQQSSTSSFDTPITPSNNTGFYYRCQSGQGKLAYHFNNDGTSPLVVDVVVTRIKKGMEAALGNGALHDSYTTGYMNYTLANRGQGDYYGQPPVAQDIFDNARVPFMPAKCLDYAEPVSPVNTTTSPAAKQRPFKQVARDQFVISGGGTRPWSMDLQSLNYRSNDYAQVPEAWNVEDVQVPVQTAFTKNADDITYIVSFGFSTLAMPFMEFSSPSLGAVIDRIPQSVNCSVTGVYTENVLPVYLASDSKTPYINGALDYVWYEDDTPVLAGVDIANASNIVRSESNSSAYINVGPSNTQPGA